jgi:glycerophosphoryl diester phosphodiesterase
VKERRDALIWHGHRGCRGLKPENSIPAFIHAMELGMDALEMDVVISADLQVVVAHEPFMPHDICKKPDGSDITEAEEKGLNLYQMDYQMIRNFDCGCPHPRFTEQETEVIHRPLLSEVFQEIEARWKFTDSTPILYTIELKSAPDFDNLYHPPPDVFVSIVLAVIRQADTLGRCILQSFDKRILKAIHEQEPTVQISLLLDKAFNLEREIETLGFLPNFLGPQFNMVTPDLIRLCHEKGILVVPWTVNEVSDMQWLADIGVDGIITDYPDRKAFVNNS